MGDMFPEEPARLASEAAEDEAGGGDAESSAGSSKVFAPIDISGCEKMTCRACNASAAGPGPFHQVGTVSDRFGGKHPWSHYISIRDASGAVVSRKPKGRICAVCRNVFALSGLDAKHNNVAAFLKTLALATPAAKTEHQEFLKKVKLYIDHQRKEAPRSAQGAAGIMVHKGVSAAIGRTTLDTVQKRGQRFSAPKREFVEVEAWDSALDGALPNAKIVEEYIHGKMRRGCWVSRGRTGVFAEEMFETKVAEQRTREADSEGIFGDERLRNKRKVLEDGLDLTDADRAEKAVQGAKSTADMSIVEMLRVLRKCDIAESEEPGSAQGGGDDDECSNQDDEDSDEDNGTLDANQHLRSFWSTPQPATQAKKHPPSGQGSGNGLKAGSNCTPCSKSSLKPAQAVLPKPAAAFAAPAKPSAASATGPTKPALAVASAADKLSGVDRRLVSAVETPAPTKPPMPAKQDAVSDMASERESLKLDGRFSRFRANLEETVSEAAKSYMDVENISLPSPTKSQQSSDQLKAYLRQKAKSAASLKTRLASLLKRCEASKHGVELQDIVEKSEKWHRASEVVIALCNHFCSASADPGQLVAILDDCEEAGVPTTAHMREHRFWAQGHHFMRFNDTAGLCSMCVKSSPDRKILENAGYSADVIESLVSDLVTDVILTTMRSGLATSVAASLPIAESEVKQSLSELVAAIRKAQESDSIHAAMHIDTLEPLVDPNSKMEALNAVLEKHEHYRAGEDVGELDPVTKFLFDSNVGKAMLQAVKVGHRKPGTHLASVPVNAFSTSPYPYRP